LGARKEGGEQAAGDGNVEETKASVPSEESRTSPNRPHHQQPQRETAGAPATKPSRWRPATSLRRILQRTE